MNKFDLINKALTADLKPILGKMLVEFIMRADENGFSHVGAERLCKVRGIKHTKNFPWKELHALSDVLTIKLGRDLNSDEVSQIEATGKTVYGDKNYFWIKPEAIMALGDFDVTKSIKPKASDRIRESAPTGSSKTPASAGSKHPASADPSTLQVQTKTPASAGCNSTKETLQEENTRETTNNATAGAVAMKNSHPSNVDSQTLSNNEVSDSPKKKSFSPKVIGGTRRVDTSFFDRKVANSSNKELVEAARSMFADPMFHMDEAPIARYFAAIDTARENMEVMV